MDPALTRIAIIPGLIIIIYIYSKDKVEKEPLGLILKLIIFGAISGFLAGYAEQIASNYLPAYPQNTFEYAVTTAFLLAAFWEELLKFLLLRLGSWRHPSFNYRFDGIVYGVSVAVGFAVLENIMYVSMYGMQTAIVRAFTAVPLHAFCGAVMGIIYSYSKKASIDGNKGASLVYTLLAWLVPLAIHGIYDTFAMMRTNTASIALIVFIVFLYIYIIKMIKKMSAEDREAGFYRRNIDTNRNGIDNTL